LTVAFFWKELAYPHNSRLHDFILISMDYLEKDELSFGKTPTISLNYYEKSTLYYSEFTFK